MCEGQGCFLAGHLAEKLTLHEIPFCEKHRPGQDHRLCEHGARQIYHLLECRASKRHWTAEDEGALRRPMHNPPLHGRIHERQPAGDHSDLLIVRTNDSVNHRRNADDRQRLKRQVAVNHDTVQIDDLSSCQRCQDC